VEIRLDGARVGELTKGQSDRYLPAVDAVLRQGTVPGCDATVRWDGES
jgi:hypothetical protein